MSLTGTGISSWPQRTTKRTAVLVEEADHLVRARFECIVAYFVKVFDDKIVDLDVRGIPSTAVDAAVEVLLRTVRATGRGDVFIRSI